MALNRIVAALLVAGFVAMANPQDFQAFGPSTTVVGFYLLNLGYVLLALKVGHSVVTTQAAVEALSVKLGAVSLVLGGVHIAEAARGLTGHSDADVLTHAIIDALLGAAGLADIGHHFPDTDPQFKGADSIELLANVRGLLAEEGLRAVHVDATVLAEAPKLGPHRDAMRQRLAGALGAPVSAVNVKFTTNEGMGFIGKGEGLAVIAVAVLEAR